MVNKCFIYGCTKYNKGQKCPTFGVPKDPDLFLKWVDILRPYSNGKTLLTRHRICHKHFMPEDMDKYYVYLIQGTEIRMEKDRPTLKSGAVPSLFLEPKKQVLKASIKNLKSTRKNSKKTVRKFKGVSVKVKKQEPRSTLPIVAHTVEFPVLMEELINVEDEEALITKYQVTEKQKFQLSDTLPVEPPHEDSLLETEVSSDKEKLPRNEEVLSEEVAFDKKMPADREVSSVCINWDAVPLPEEIGSLLCDSGARGSSTRTDFNVKLPRKDLTPLKGLKSPIQLEEKAGSNNSNESRSKEQPSGDSLAWLSSCHKSVPMESTNVNFSSISDVAETLPDQPCENDLTNSLKSPTSSVKQKSSNANDTTKHFSTVGNTLKPTNSLQRRGDPTEAAARNASPEDIENISLSFSEFKKKFTELKLPSSLWATHTTQSSVFFSLLTFDSHGFQAVPRVERIVMYEGSMRPRLFMRATEVRVPSISEADTNTMLAVFNILSQVQNLRLCLGLNRADEAFSFSPNCDGVLDSVKVHRCTACRKEREIEYAKKRFLEYGSGRSDYRSQKKR